MNEKLKICHFTYSFFPLIGGMEEVIHNLSLSLLSEGCEPYVFAPYVRGRNNKLDIPYKVLRYSRPSSRRFGLKQLLIPLLWYHFKYRFDILHCHGVYPPGYVGSSFHKITGVPLVITPHGGDIETNGKGYIISKRITNKIRKTFKSAQAVTAISSDIKNRILKLGAPPDKIYVIPNGVFVKDFQPSAFEEKNDKNPYILYLGGLRKVKGVDILLHAYAKVKKKFPNLRLKIAGDGKEKENLQMLSNNLGIKDAVDFLGTVIGYEKVKLLQNALFLVCPSRYESFGITLLEAFASGIPVIASRVGGVPDIVIDRENGFLFSPERQEELAEKIEIILNDNHLRTTMARNALQQVNRYDWNLIVREYIDIYLKLL